MMTRFREKNPVTMGIAGIVVTFAVIALSFQLANVPLFSGTAYKAEFSESGGMESGAQVWLAGTPVGKVTDLKLDGNRVIVTFRAKHVDMGDQTTAAIKTASLLGKRYLALYPAGTKMMSGGDTIPLTRTTPPYDLSRSLEDVTKQVGGFDKPQIEAALNTFADALQNTPQGFRETFVNVRRLSETISSRDQAVAELLQHANGVSAVLNDRKDQLKTLIVDGNSLLSELQHRQQVLTDLIENLTYAAQQASHFIRENNGQFGPVLDKLNELLALLQKNNTNIANALSRVSSFLGGLGEGVAGSRGFSAGIIPATAVFSFNDMIPQLASGFVPKSAPLPNNNPLMPPGMAGTPGSATPHAPALPAAPELPTIPLGGN
jgi:phospholipid/cholesterol/gamma-HCH transport system substrate-binding protein